MKPTELDLMPNRLHIAHSVRDRARAGAVGFTASARVPLLGFPILEAIVVFGLGRCKQDATGPLLRPFQCLRDHLRRTAAPTQTTPGAGELLASCAKSPSMRNASMEENGLRVRAFDLFCGAGGSSCGAQQAGAEIVGGIDLWETAADTYQLNYPAARVYRCPIDELDARRLARELGPIDLLLASPECTNHSVAKGAAPRDEASRRTAFDVLRFAEAWKPRWVVVENVVSMQRWHAYDEWLNRLKGLGYNTDELKLNAAHFGVPQSRRRLFVIADREREPVAPKCRTGRAVPVKRILHRGANRLGYNYTRRPLRTTGRAQPTIERADRAIASIGPKKPFLIVYYGSDAAGGWQSLDRPLRTVTTLDRFALVEPSSKGHEMRMLQPPELAAAMGFPATYAWSTANRRERIKLIGNAVAPPVMKAVVQAIIS